MGNLTIKTNLKILCLAAVLLIPKTAASQLTPYNRCILNYGENTVQFENWMKLKTTLSVKNTKVYYIPVVVHVLHTGEPVGEGLNISLEQIESQLRVINEDFRRKIGTRGYNDHPDGGDARIEFVLAKSTPDGRPSNGINRVDISIVEPPGFGGSMIALGAYYTLWDPYQYLNIWAFPGIMDAGLGEARFPVSDLPGLDKDTVFSIPGFDSVHGIAVNDIDGIAINSVHFGEVPIESPYSLGRTGTHELGHFLGLYHVWGDKGFEGSCELDDYCNDTPNTSERTSGCPVDKLACDATKAMIENYMDYTNDACMNVFTNNQIDRMRTVLENSPRRNSLLTSKGLHPPGTTIHEMNTDEIHVYPNPAGSYIYVEFQNTSHLTGAIFQLFDITGNKISTEPPIFMNSSAFGIKLPPMAAGTLFILEVSIDNQVWWYKLVKK